MTSIHSWLQRIGLDRYAETFAAEDIDVDVLPELTEADLVELGVSFGDRKKLLRAIATLNGVSPEAAARARSAALGEAGEDQGAEQRHLTVMFCDLVGSTELASRYEPEDLRPIVRAYQDTCAGVVARLEGYVARYMGDGVLVYFGFPRAHEDDAERAIRAGLEIVEAVGRLRLQDNLKLQTRVGIATGSVIVGDLIGLGAAQEFAAVGESPNLAARLQGIAGPDSVVIDSATYSLAASAFDCEDLGPQSLKGIARPAPAWRVLRPRDLDRRMEAMQGDDLVPFVNRTGEITLLLDRWRMASRGHGQIVLLSGEAGIGKSRLLRAFVDRLAGEDFLCHNFHCTPFHRSSALFPLVDRLRRVAGLAADDPPAVALAKLRRLVKDATGDAEELLRLLTPLFSLEPGEEESGLADGQADMDRLLEILVREIEAVARRRPLLLIVEDLHWIDPSSLELLQRLSLRIGGLPILLALTLRPEAEAEMRHLFPATGLMLNGLQRPESETIIRHIARQKELPQELVDAIAERTDGVALFIEQLTKAVLESDAVVDQGDRYAIASEEPALSIPTTLRGSLLARLDRYPGAREVAQIGAVIGREFSYRMMAAISALPEEDLKFALKRLVEAELLYQAGVPPKATYRFKHALVQEMAYNSLLKKRRRRLHGAIAAYLEDRSPQLAVVEPELLAYHFTESSQLQRAIAYRLQAGERAIQRSAMAEAATEIDLGLRLLPAITDEAEHAALELQLRVAQATALRATKGTGAPETGAAWARARALCGDDNKSLLSRILYGSFLYHQGNAQLKEAHALGESLLALGGQLGDERALLRGHMAIGRTAFGLGDFPEARRHLEAAIALNDPERHKSGSEADRPESPVIDLCYLSWTSFVMGRPETALQQCHQSIAVAEAAGGWYDLVVAHGNACYLRQLLHEPSEVAHCARKVIEVASDKGYPHWLSLGSMFEGWVTAAGGDLAAGIATFETALAEHRATGEVIEVCFYLGVLAEMLGRAGRIDDGLARIAAALELVEQTGERWYEAELHRGRGELLRLAAPADHAGADRVAVENAFMQAIELARAQQAKLWELRAAISLARLWRDQSRDEEARALLEPLCRSFETPELDEDGADRRAAQALLEELGVKARR